MTMKEQIGQIVGLLSMPWILYLLWDAIRSESILVKGRGEALGGFARRVHREENPVTYWCCFVFYAGVSVFLGATCLGTI